MAADSAGEDDESAPVRDADDSSEYPSRAKRVGGTAWADDDDRPGAGGDSGLDAADAWTLPGSPAV